MVMPPEMWGPYGWTFLGYVALGFPDNATLEDRIAYGQMFKNLWRVLPCQKCADNYRRHLKEVPPIEDFMTSGIKLFEWVWKVHNIVNKELGKPQISFEEALETMKNGGVYRAGMNNKIESFFNTPGPQESQGRTQKHIYYMLVVVAVFILLLMIFYSGKKFLKK